MRAWVTDMDLIVRRTRLVRGVDPSSRQQDFDKPSVNLMIALRTGNNDRKMGYKAKV